MTTVTVSFSGGCSEWPWEHWLNPDAPWSSVQANVLHHIQMVAGQCSSVGKVLPANSLRIMGVQLNPAPGDLAGNARQIARAMQLADVVQADWLVLPELVLMGYPIRDAVVRFPFLVADQLRWLKALTVQSTATLVAIGFVEPRPLQAPGKPYYNALAIVQHGHLMGLVRKTLLPTYHEYEEWRTFESALTAGSSLTHWPEWTADFPTVGTVPGGAVLDTKGCRVALSICEDIWNDTLDSPNPQQVGRPLYAYNPLGRIMAQKPHLLLNASASVSRWQRLQQRQNIARGVARRYGCPVVYVNQVGAVDECCFDGASFVVDAQGVLQAQAPAFTVGALLVDVDCGLLDAPPLPQPRQSLALQKLEPPVAEPPPAFSLSYSPEQLHFLYQQLVMGIRQYFQKTGFQRALLGLSGGIDSTVTAVLLADALGPANVLALSFPTAITPECNRQDARNLAANLGLPWVEIPIGGAVEAFLQGVDNQRQAIAPYWGEPASVSFASDNAQAISRATWLRLLGNDYGALPIATSDKSEFYLGYATVNGDMSGALAPLGDVTKTQVQALAHWMNEHRSVKNIIPSGILQRPPGADLAIDPSTGKPLLAEVALLPYAFTDEVIWRMEMHGEGYDQLQAACFVWEQDQGGPLTPQEKRRWLDKFFKRMASAVFKWWLAPPILMVSPAGSLAKTAYHHPIVANRIRWQGWTEQAIASALSDAAEQ